jgi:hypothetical protein
MDRAAAERRSFGFRLFASGKDEGLLMRPETGTFCIGDTEAALTAHLAYRDGGRSFTPIRIRSIVIWKLQPTHQGFIEARESRIWAPDID